MPVTLPLEVFEALEKGLGKDDARAVVKSIEATISEATEYKWATTKDELLDAIRREFVTRELFEERINALRAELLGIMKQDKAELLGIMKQDKAELLGRIDALYEKTEKDKAELLGIMKQNKAELLGRIDALYEKTEKDKAELLGIMKQDKAELLGIMKQDKAELLGRIDTARIALDRKFTVMFVILFFTIIFLNQNALEFIFRVLGLIR